MYQRIRESLSRQDKGLELLSNLLEEEYEVLRARDTDKVASLEFSIQELIRHLAVEKSLVIRSLEGKRVLEFAGTLPEEQKQVLESIFQSVDEREQIAARQASRNAQLSLALLDQSTNTLKVLTSQVVPPLSGVYSRYGDMRHEMHPQAAIISGRL